MAQEQGVALGGETGSRAAAAAASSAKWLVLLAAFRGWMFDGLEMGIFPLVARPALTDLLQHASHPPADLASAIKHWQGYIDALFLAGAACGGLVFGYLGDRI